ncbi:AHH domain-containing protein [Bradyrhizobium sp. 23AC]
MSIFFDHHIIPERFRGHPAFRGIDKKTFDIDAPANRIYLPANRELAAKLEVSPHPSRHVEPYGDFICKRLKEIATIESPDERLVEIKTLIDAMRVGFLNGHLYTNVPIGKTQEEVYQGIEKVLTDPKAYRGQYPDQLRTIRDVERRGADAGQDHLIKWLLYLDDPERQRLIDEAIARNPDVNLTAGNRDLGGTNWSKFEASDPSSDIFRVPGSTSANPSDFPPLPGSSSPPLAGLNKQEGFARSDPRFTRALPPFPTLDPNEQRIGQLPPTTAAPSDPLVLQSDPHSGITYPYYENPLAGGTSPERGVLPWLAGGAAVGLAAPSVLPWLLGIGGILAFTRAANAEENSSGTTMGAAALSGGVFSTGAPPLNIIGNGLNVDNAASSSGSSASSTFGRQVGGASSTDPETCASTFADRFGNWANTPDGTVPAEPANVDRLPDAPPGGSVAPENVRRLARVNESNAGSVFTSGSAPVPYPPSTEFNERFGNWTVPTAGNGQLQPSKPVGLFADEPSYVIPPSIFGVDGPGNPHSDAEEWFSRWIRPLLRPE